jgi:hypothetical protein
MQMGRAARDQINHRQGDPLLQVATHFRNKGATCCRTIFVARAHQFNSRHHLWPTLLLDNYDFHRIRKDGRNDCCRRLCCVPHCYRLFAACSHSCMLECSDIDFYTRAELDIGSSEVPIRQEPSIEDASNRCCPGVMEGVPYTLNAEGRTKMI